MLITHLQTFSVDGPQKYIDKMIELATDDGMFMENYHLPPAGVGFNEYSEKDKDYV